VRRAKSILSDLGREVGFFGNEERPAFAGRFSFPVSQLGTFQLLPDPETQKRDQRADNGGELPPSNPTTAQMIN
jgi:hypothetical protein